MNPSLSRLGQFYLLAFGVLAAVAYQTARAQEPLRIPGADISIPGVVEKSSIATPEINGADLADLSSAEALTMQFKDAVPRTRGAQDISLFRQIAPYFFSPEARCSPISQASSPGRCCWPYP
jgi:hypothetical protein